MAKKRTRSGENARERGIDPAELCSICGEPFAGFDLHDDHVMPIGSHQARDGLVLAYNTSNGEFTACLLSEVPPDADVFKPVPCGALAHTRCNLSKGATRDISQWRHLGLPTLVVAVNKTGQRVALPPLQVLDPSPETDWTVAQQEAHDRGVEALRRRGSHDATDLKTVDEIRAETLRLEREHRRAAAAVKANEMIAAAETKLAEMTDYAEVRKAIQRITAKHNNTQAAFSEVTDQISEVRTEVDAALGALPLIHITDEYFDGCFDYDAADAEVQRWETTLRLAQTRCEELYDSAVAAFKQSTAGRGLAASLKNASDKTCVKVFNQREAAATGNNQPAAQAKADIAREALKGRDIKIGSSKYHTGDYAYIATVASTDTTYVDAQGRLIHAATGAILQTDKQTSTK